VPRSELGGHSAWSPRLNWHNAPRAFSGLPMSVSGRLCAVILARIRRNCLAKSTRLTISFDKSDILDWDRPRSPNGTTSMPIFSLGPQASTEPSRRLRPQPWRPNAIALFAKDARYPTPCTRPSIINRLPIANLTSFSHRKASCRIRKCLHRLTVNGRRSLPHLISNSLYSTTLAPRRGPPRRKHDRATTTTSPHSSRYRICASCAGK
jgi:hypothetical protein